MSTTITDLADVEPGDIVTWTLDGREYTGPCYASPMRDGVLCVAGYVLRGAAGGRDNFATFVRAERPAPEPPSEPGTVILVHAIDEEPLPEPLVGIVDADGDVYLGLDSPSYRRRDRITSWQAVDVTPRGEVLRRG